MNKAEIINRVQEAHPELGKAVVKNVVESVFDKIRDILKDTGTVKIQNLLSVQVFRRKERKGKHPRTGETITVPESNGVRIKVSTELKRLLQEIDPTLIS